MIVLIMVGINIILSFEKEYVKLAREFTGKQGQENWDFWNLKKFEITWKTKILYILKSSVSWKDIGEK